jgi:hypothetical protein
MVLLTLTALAAALIPSPASAAPFPAQIACTGAGVVGVVPAPPGPGANQWTITGQGSCLGDNQGTYFAGINAIGTSDTLGACDDPFNPTMLNFELTATITLTSTSDPNKNKVLTETWSAPVTTFPIAVPFLISDGGLRSENDFVGAGVIFTRIHGLCPPAGNPSGWIEWARTLETA